MRGDAPNTTLIAWQERHPIITSAIAGIFFATALTVRSMLVDDEPFSAFAFGFLAVGFGTTLYLSGRVGQWWRRRRPVGG